MPELPEVETVRLGLARLLPNRQIVGVDFDWPKSFPNAQADAQKFIIGAKVVSIKRRAKVLLIEIDETPVGTFVELEGPMDAIDRAAQELGFSKRDYITKSYLQVYVEECRHRGEEPRNMLFSVPKKSVH